VHAARTIGPIAPADLEVPVAQPREALIIDAVRSPRGTGKETGSLHPVHPQRVLAQVLNALRDRTGLDTRQVDDVVMGCGAG
jgi:acetyl-CoA C-acetyltransferase